MGDTLAGETVNFGPKRADLNLWPIPLVGKAPDGSNVIIGASAAVAASGTLTSDNTNVTTLDTVTIGLQVYTFKTALTAITTANQVLIGADADASLLNLIRAINATGTPGTDYGSLTPQNPLVTAAAAVTAHAFLITANTPGGIGNAIVTTEGSTHLSWGAATLQGGLNAGLNIAPFATAYETVAASQTTQVLGTTGAAGDYLAGLLVIPATTGAGAIALLDNTTSISVFATGTLSDLKPFYIPLGIRSINGAWKVTTGASVSVIAIGSFT